MLGEEAVPLPAAGILEKMLRAGAERWAVTMARACRGEARASQREQGRMRRRL